MGTVYKRGKTWYIDAKNGKRRIRKKVGTSKRLAEEALKELEAKIVRKEMDLDVEDSSLKELFKRFEQYSEM